SPRFPSANGNRWCALATWPWQLRNSSATWDWISTTRPSGSRDARPSPRWLKPGLRHATAAKRKRCLSGTRYVGAATALSVNCWQLMRAPAWPTRFSNASTRPVLGGTWQPAPRCGCLTWRGKPRQRRPCWERIPTRCCTRCWASTERRWDACTTQASWRGPIVIQRRTALLERAADDFPSTPHSKSGCATLRRAAGSLNALFESAPPAPLQDANGKEVTAYARRALHGVAL